jgi:hypothetical protein
MNYRANQAWTLRNNGLVFQWKWKFSWLQVQTVQFLDVAFLSPFQSFNLLPYTLFFIFFPFFNTLLSIHSLILQYKLSFPARSSDPIHLERDYSTTRICHHNFGAHYAYCYPEHEVSDYMNIQYRMRSPVTGVLWLYGLILATTISGVCGDTEPNFLSVRKNVTKEYKSEREIPTEKYFRKYNPSVDHDLQFPRSLVYKAMGLWSSY